MAAIVSDSLYGRLLLAARGFDASTYGAIATDLLAKMGVAWAQLWKTLDLDAAVDRTALDGTIAGHLLGAGNYQVYKDIFWQHLLYDSCGAAAFRGTAIEPELAEGLFCEGGGHKGAARAG
jgi:hypothetical protein